MKRSKHSLSNYKLLSCDLGELVPIGLLEVLPGDSIQQSTNALIRAAPLLAPVMHPVKVSISHWFIPFRLIWEDFEKFITGGPDGMDASVFPTATGFNSGPAGGIGSLADYLGVPAPVTVPLTLSMLPFRAYNMVFNEWFRDQDLVSPVAISTASGNDSTTSIALQNAAWGKDYFTAARPWEQKGPSITVPLGTSAPVNYTHANTNSWVAKKASDGATYTPAGDDAVEVAAAGTVHANTGSVGLQFDPRNNLLADLSGASAVTVNVLREALALQRYEEARARYGSRYTEYLQYLGVRSSDARLQRPEYLGGGQETIQFSEVLQTAEGADPVGTLRGHGISSMRSNRYRRFFEEHGYVLSLITARPKAIYASGLPRTWNRRTKEDFWQQELQHIGQQPIQNQEIRAEHATPLGTFGYQDRYDEYRSQWSTVAGEFRSTLNYWHFARFFASSPSLNADFVKCVPTETPFAVPSEDVLQIMARHSIQARRLVCKTGSSFIY